VSSYRWSKPGTPRLGSDFFSPVDTLHVFITAAVKGALQRADVRNVIFERVSEMEVRPQ